MTNPKTNTISPWALIKISNTVPGQGPCLQLVYISDWVVVGGDYTNHRGYVICDDGSLSKILRTISPKSVRCAWRDRPSKADIKRFKDSLPVKG